MPLAVSFNAACARGLGLGNGEAPRAPVINTPSADDTTIGGAIGAAIAYTITVTTFPISYVQYKLDKIDSSNAVTDAGQFTGSLPGASGSNSTTLSTRITSTGSSENLIYDQKYALYLRSVDGSGQIGPESLVRRFTTSNEVAPTAVAPTLASTSVSHDTAPFISITWAAGTQGTYAIATRKYSVVAGTGAAGADNTFTAVTGSTGTVSVTTTAAGVAILPNTQYTVYMKYAASSPGVTSTTASATITTAVEIVASAPTISLASTPTTITITRGNVPTPPTPTYLYKYQYAYGTSASPTNFADFSSSDTTQTITGLLHATTFYVSIKAVSLVTGASGAISSTSIATAAEVAPTAVAPTLTSTSVSYSTAPFISITWAAGTAGTYAIATRQYSVVAGTGAAGTFTTASGTTGTVSVTTTAAGASILPNTQYTVYMKYIASSPGATSTTASATHTTAAEILASAPSVSLASTPTTITITRGDVPTPPVPTYLYKYQYAYGTTVDPTNFADFPSTGTASSVTLTGLTTNTTYYVRVRAIATGGALSPGATSSASVLTSNEVAPTFTFTSANLTSESVSYSTPPFISIAYTAGTAGTYAIGTRQYSVVGGPINISNAVHYPYYGTTEYTTSTAHGFSVGDSVTVAGITPSLFNVTRTIAGINNSTSFYFTLGPNGTYSSGGTATGNAGTFTTISGSSPVSVTTTAAGAAILPGTQYTVYMKYIATSPGVASTIISATHTTAAEILANAPSLAHSSTPTTITITRGDYTNSPTYQQKYQYAYGTSASPTNFADFPTSGTASSVTITGLMHATTFYLLIRAIATGGALSPGATSSATRATAAEVAPTAVAPTLTSTSVSYSTAPFISITWAAGTAGTYAIGTRQYSVVAGTGAAGTFTTVSGTTGTVSVTTTAAGAAILPGTSYRVYMKYIASSPGTASSPEVYATHTTAAEILANAPSLTHSSTPTKITITRGNHTNSPAPTYLQNYQYAISEINPPTDFIYFPNFGFDSTVEINNLPTSTRHYLLIRAIATAGALSPGETSSAFRDTQAEVAPTAVVPTLASDSVLSPTLPYIGITWAAGTAGTYPIGARKYSVVLGTAAAGADNTFTAVTGTTGTVSVTTTAAGVAILPGTQYTVYMKYFASSPGTAASPLVSDTITTGAEVKGGLITAAVELPTDVNDGRTKLKITRGNWNTATTYVQKYQYAISETNPPTNFVDFPTSGTTYTVTGLDNDTTYYVRTRTKATGGAESTGTNQATAVSATTNPALPTITPTLTFDNMTTSSFGTANFTINVYNNNNNKGSTTKWQVQERTYGEYFPSIYHAVKSYTVTSFSIANYLSDGGTKHYRVVAMNRLDEQISSSEITWTRPKKDVDFTVYSSYGASNEAVLAATDTALDGCSPTNISITFSNIPSNVNAGGYKKVTEYGMSMRSKADGAAGFYNTSSVKFREPSGTDYSVGSNLATANFDSASNSNPRKRTGITTMDGTSLNGTLRIHFPFGTTGSLAARLGSTGFGCAPIGTNPQYFFVKGFYATGKQTLPGSFVNI